MSDWPVTLLHPSVLVETVPAARPFEPETLAEVDRIWAAATAANSTLFNGTIFSADLITPDRIIGHWTEYRFAFAQLRRHALAPVLRIRPLAVTGVVRAADGVLVARRSRGSVYQPGFWQCAPAGSVEVRDGDNAVDLARQVAAELEEELGIPADACLIGRPLAAVSHPGSAITDIGLPIETPLAFEAVRERHETFGNVEYDELAVIAPADIETWIAAHGDRIAPPTAFFLRLAVASHGGRSIKSRSS